jgi:Sulfotransferase family
MHAAHEPPGHGRLPDFLIIGAPKAGTSALHSALARHPDLHLSEIKEPKYFLCGDAPPPSYRGPGDAHSCREWVWRRDEYEALFATATEDQLCGESTPFYLYDEDAQRRMAAQLPCVRLIAVLRDPIDRAYSNWMHLWSDGLEPMADFAEACEAEQARIDAGWAPFWHYRSMGAYGRQLDALFQRFDRDHVLILRYRELVDEPQRTLDRVCRFLGVSEGLVTSVPTNNSRPFVPAGPRARILGRGLRIGARAGALFPPHMWRRASRPLIDWRRSDGDAPRPTLSGEQRASLLQPLLADIDLLERVTGQSFDDWRGDMGRGSFHHRVRRGSVA